MVDQKTLPSGPKKRSARGFLRAVHRDAGYLAVGLTFVYALSGLAVNHITDWKDGDPSFSSYTVTHELGSAQLGTDEAVATHVREALRITEKPKEIFAPSPDEVDVLFAQLTLHVNRRTGRVVEEGRRPRPVLRDVNWLHLNRGKKAWTYVADAYAVGLLLLATSGMFMIAGKKGLLGRGAILVALGAAVPIVYVLVASN